MIFRKREGVPESDEEEEYTEEAPEEETPTECDSEPSPEPFLDQNPEPPSETIRVPRKVTGRIPSYLRVRATSAPSRAPIERPQPEPVEYIPQRVPMMPRKPTNAEIRQRAQTQAQYLEMVQQERARIQRVQQAPRKPRVSTSRKMLAVANAAAGTNRGNPVQIVKRGQCALFRKPNVSVPSSAPKKNAISSFNAMIKDIAPKKKMKPFAVKGKSKKKGFGILSF